MKYVAIAVVVILVAAGAGWFVMRGKAEAASTATTQPTSKVERRTLEKIVSANGKVASNRDVDIKCQASGKVIAIPFDISAKVKLGDLLLELGPKKFAEWTTKQKRLLVTDTTFRDAHQSLMATRVRS